MNAQLPTPLKNWQLGLIVVGLAVLMAWPRLTALNQYRIVDEADRWNWAESFVLALNAGNLAATRIGDGYPGIVPVWAESGWVFLEAARRSVVEGRWIGDAGMAKLFHEWDRPAYLYQQRLPIVLLNTLLALAVVGAVWKLFGQQIAIISGVLIALDPFYLSDSRVNRAEALITGLMTLCVLFLIFYYQKKQFRYVLLSGIFGGLSFLTKIQALAILPAIALAGLLIVWLDDTHRPPAAKIRQLLVMGLGWALAAAVTWVALWPAMWVIPLDTLTLVYNYATRKVGAEGVKLFFMGETYEDIDPGAIFYPLVFLMRTTPLALLGLIAAAVWRWRNRPALPPGLPVAAGSAILLIFVLAYALVMTQGSHKQDRYLMPIFLGLDILAAVGLNFAWEWLKPKLEARWSQTLSPRLAGAILLAAVVIGQWLTVAPHHPYYYSYFNPLFGGGQTAAQTMRIGWGEGMDLAGAYLAAKPNAKQLVVSSRFTHNMLGFPGELISLGGDGRWTKADYIVLYIQQVQRRLDPSPEFLDYFQAKPPEKVITLGNLDYVWIYPIPFTTAANPQVSLIPAQAALQGYSWEATPDGGFQLRLVWQNLGLNRPLRARLAGPTTATAWADCRPAPGFETPAQTLNAYVESLCRPQIEALPSGTYTVEFGLASPSETFLFPESWDATTITAAGQVQTTPAGQRLDSLAQDNTPPNAIRLDRVYDGELRLAAYQLEPPQPRPGDALKLTLYWQAVKELTQSANLTVQLADSHSISLGRADALLAKFNPQAPAGQRWFPGQLKTTTHRFTLPPQLKSPLAGRIEVSLANDAEVALPPATRAGQPLDKVIGRFTIAPQTWPAPANLTPPPAEARWQNGISLAGYATTPAQPRPGSQLTVNLFWQTGQPITDDYQVFVHLVNAAGQLVAQNDAVPRLGAYPTPWWLPGVIIEDGHPLALPPNLPPGAYQLVVGLYRTADGARLPLAQGGDNLPLGRLEILKEVQ